MRSPPSSRWHALLILLGGERFPGRPIALVVVVCRSSPSPTALGHTASLSSAACRAACRPRPPGHPATSTACSRSRWLPAARLHRGRLGRSHLRRQARVCADVRQELLGLGAANLLVALGGGYPVAGGLSQSAVNDKAGARTPWPWSSRRRPSRSACCSSPVSSRTSPRPCSRPSCWSPSRPDRRPRAAAPVAGEPLEFFVALVALAACSPRHPEGRADRRRGLDSHAAAARRGSARRFPRPHSRYGELLRSCPSSRERASRGRVGVPGRVLAPLLQRGERPRRVLQRLREERPCGWWCAIFRARLTSTSRARACCAAWLAARARMRVRSLRITDAPSAATRPAAAGRPRVHRRTHQIGSRRSPTRRTHSSPSAGWPRSTTWQ